MLSAHGARQGGLEMPSGQERQDKHPPSNSGAGAGGGGPAGGAGVGIATGSLWTPSSG